MATKKILISLSSDLSTTLTKAIKEIEAAVVKVGLQAFGPDYKDMVNNPSFGKFGISFRKTPRGMKATLAGLYRDAWRERYLEIATEFAAHASDQHKKWKERHIGDAPYDKGQFRVYHTRPAKMTGHLEESVAKDMLLLRNSQEIKFANLSVTGGFTTDITKFPKRVTYDRGGAKTTDTVSYVERFVETLVQTGVLAREENLVDFSKARWTQIATVMQGYAEREFVNEVESFLKSWKVDL